MARMGGSFAMTLPVRGSRSSGGLGEGRLGDGLGESKGLGMEMRTRGVFLGIVDGGVE